MSAIRCALPIMLLLASGAGYCAGPDLHEGRWETTVRVTVDDIAFPAPFTSEKCITKDDLIPNSVTDGTQCVIEDIEIVGNDVSWTVTCTDDKGSLRGHGVVTYAGTTLKGAMEMVARDPGGKVVSEALYDMKGERKGDCE